jgi:MFS transporter, PAT family, beta-lactamase induction signal transducer AmpG
MVPRKFDIAILQVQARYVAFLAVFRSRRMAVLFLLGFASGLPLYLTGQLLSAWLTSAGVSIEGIATFSMVGLAYTFKPTWAWLLDRYELPFLGRRRGWILVSQIALVVAIIAMGLVDPVAHPGELAILAVVVAFLSASQDIVIDAYSVDLLAPEERAAGSAIYVIGYRVAMLLTGTLALFFADFVPWSVIYGVIGALMLVGVVATLMAVEPPAPSKPATTIAQAIYLPFTELFKRFGLGAVVVLAFVPLYKFGDSFAQSLLIPFFNRGLGFQWIEIALVYKIVAFVGIFAGGMSAGTLVARFGMRRMLFAFGILQASTNLLYALAAAAGKNYALFTTAVLVDNITGAMGTAAFVAFLMSVCTPGVSAMQMALLHSLSSVGQRVFGFLADDVVNRFHPQGFEQLASRFATVEEILRPKLDAALVQLQTTHFPDWIAYAKWQPFKDLAAYRKGLVGLVDPTGPAMITQQSWSYFFTVTALMAIPGLLLALVAGRKVAQSTPAS